MATTGSTARIEPPLLAGLLLVAAPILMFVGGNMFLGTSHADYFAGLPLVATIGCALVLAGFIMLMTSLSLYCMRYLVQQHLDAVLHIQGLKADAKPEGAGSDEGGSEPDQRD